MTKVRLDNPITQFLIPNPEEVFDLPSLTYKTTEIQAIIRRLEMPRIDRPSYQWVITLLHALVDFRRSTIPTGPFAELRTATKSKKSLNEVFVNMQFAWEKASHRYDEEMSQTDRRILLSAIAYTKNSILDRISNIKKSDPLYALWQQSELKKLLE